MLELAISAYLKTFNKARYTSKERAMMLRQLLRLYRLSMKTTK
jgi:hypothetical protein